MEIATGRWWRFDRYEIRHGFIRPAAGARFEEFDPWAAYYRECGGQVGEPPHTRLVNLVRRLDPRIVYESGPVEVDQVVTTGLLAWCSQNGLLGLLPHTVLFARIGNVVMTRSCDPWLPLAEFEGFPRERPRSEAIVVPIGGEPSSESIDDVWCRYFPDVQPEMREQHNYPPPLSDKFWMEYAEPVDDLVRAARYFATAVTRLADGATDTAEGPLIVDARSARARINGLARVVEPSLDESPDGKLRRSWHSPSLLGTLAMQAAQDILNERRTVTCACGNVFTSANLAVKYCHNTCGNRYRQQRFQARKRLRGRKALNRPR